MRCKSGGFINRATRYEEIAELVDRGRSALCWHVRRVVARGDRRLRKGLSGGRADTVGCHEPLWTVHSPLSIRSK
jgi:hypothetical protein